MHVNYRRGESRSFAGARSKRSQERRYNTDRKYIRTCANRKHRREVHREFSQLHGSKPLIRRLWWAREELILAVVHSRWSRRTVSHVMYW